MEGRRSACLQRVKSEEISVMTRQLATLLGAGIPLVQCLDSLVAQTRNAVLKKVIAQIKGSVNEGNTLTNALAEHPKLFSSIFINMVRAGEASGALDIVLERLADFGEKQEVLKGRLRAALVYPVFMAVIGSAILFILITYIVPNITQVFNEMDQVLPLPTLLLIGLSDFLKIYWWALFVLLGIVFFRFALFHFNTIWKIVLGFVQTEGIYFRTCCAKSHSRKIFFHSGKFAGKWCRTYELNADRSDPC